MPGRCTARMRCWPAQCCRSFTTSTQRLAQACEACTFDRHQRSQSIRCPTVAPPASLRLLFAYCQSRKHWLITEPHRNDTQTWRQNGAR